MARTIASWWSGPARRQYGPDFPEVGPGHQSGPGEPGRQPRYPGETLGLPEDGPRSLAGMGRRVAALAVDWLVAYGLAALAIAFGLLPLAVVATAVMVIWVVVGAVAVWLFGFTPGQFALGLVVASVNGRPHVGLGRAVVRGVMVALVIPALFVDVDGRGLQDRVSGTAVLRR